MNVSSSYEFEINIHCTYMSNYFKHHHNKSRIVIFSIILFLLIIVQNTTESEIQNLSKSHTKQSYHKHSHCNL